MSCFVPGSLKRQSGLPMLLAGFVPLGVDRPDRCLDAKWLKQTDDLGTDRQVNPQRAKGDAGLGAVINERAATMIAADVTSGATIGDMQLAAAVATSKHAGQKRLAATDRAA